LKLFFTELADDETFQSLVLEQAALHRSMLERYEWLWRRYGNRPEYAHRVLALQAGLHVNEPWCRFGRTSPPTGQRRSRARQS
jgi:hypothetical protein